MQSSHLDARIFWWQSSACSSGGDSGCDAERGGSRAVCYYEGDSSVAHLSHSLHLHIRQTGKTNWLKDYWLTGHYMLRSSFSRMWSGRTPKANWERASEMLRGEMMMLGLSGVLSRFCRSSRPSFWMAAAMACLDSRFRPMAMQPSSGSSSEDPPVGLASVGGAVVSFFVSWGVQIFTTFRNQSKMAKKRKRKEYRLGSTPKMFVLLLLLKERVHKIRL